jgi:purine-nucleoside phosphorylase
MTPAFAEFAATVRELAPRGAAVLGSGLADAASAFRERASISFADVPGLVPPTIRGHKGRLAVGLWGEVPAMLFSGRLHFYEGHPWDVVMGPIRVAAELGAKTLILTNAAGGIHPSLDPGSLMAIRGHIKLLGREAWRELVSGENVATPYSPRLLRAMKEHEAASGRDLMAGVYVALTGPSYETPAEIRMLRRCGADAVGMSTAMEAEAAAKLGLEVAALSCITNKAAGLSDAPLDHREVLDNAKLAVGRLGELLRHLVKVG